MTFGNYIYQDNTSQSRQNAINQIIDTADKLEAGHLKAVETASELKTAIGSLDFNEKDAWLKDELLQGLEKTINDNIQYGNMYYALSDLVATQSNIFSDARVTGRLKSQQAHKAFIEATDKRTDITEDKKEWIKYLNPYHYEDNVGKDGRILEGTIWTPTRNINSDFDYSSIIIKAINQVAKPDSFSKQTITYVDKNGNPVDIKSNPYGVWGATIQRENSSEVTKLTYDEIESAIDSLLNSTPGALESLKNDYEFAIWYYNNHNGDDKYNVTIGNGNNGFISPEDFKKRMFKGSIDAAKYTKTSQKVSDKILSANYANGGMNLSDKSGIVKDPVTIGMQVQGTPIKTNYKFYDNAKNNIDKSIYSAKTIGSKYGFNYNITDENFLENINKIKAEIIATSQINGSALNQTDIDELNRLQEDYLLNKTNIENLKNGYLLGLTEKEQKEYQYQFDFVNGLGRETLTNDNPYYKKFTDIKNRLNSSALIDNNGDININIKLKNYKKLTKYLKDNNINLLDYDIVMNGTNLIIPNNDSSILLMSNIYDNIDVSLSNPPYYEPLSVVFEPFSKLINETNSKLNKTMNNALKDNTEVTYNTTILPSFSYATIGNEISTEGDRLRKVALDEISNKLSHANLSQYKVLTHIDKDGKPTNKIDYTNFEEIESGEERNNLRNIITGAINKGNFSIAPINDRIYGPSTIITILADPDSNGKYKQKAAEYLIPGLISDNATELWRTDSNVIASNEINRLDLRPGQTTLSLYETDFPQLGQINITSLGNQLYTVQYQNKFSSPINTNIATRLHHYSKELELAKQAIKKGEQLQVENAKQIVDEYSKLLSQITGIDYYVINNDLSVDLGLK